MATTFDDSLMNEIRSRNNIVQVVGDYVSLKKAGGSYKGLCPFHGEKTPSFTVNESRQFFYCFGCQAGGDVISFVMEMHGSGELQKKVDDMEHVASKRTARMMGRRRSSRAWERRSSKRASPPSTRRPAPASTARGSRRRARRWPTRATPTTRTRCSR